MPLSTIPPAGVSTGAPTWDASGNLSVTGNFTLTGNASGVIKSGTAVASTSGTSIDFTGIPSTAKRITVMFNSVSTNGTSAVIVQLGSTTFTTSGYVGAIVTTINTVSATVSLNSGFMVGASMSAASAIMGTLVCSQLIGNSWNGTGILGRGNEARVESVGGSITVGGVVDRVRITTVNGTDTFDAGSINILWE